MKIRQLLVDTVMSLNHVGGGGWLTVNIPLW